MSMSQKNWLRSWQMFVLFLKMKGLRQELDACGSSSAPPQWWNSSTSAGPSDQRGSFDGHGEAVLGATPRPLEEIGDVKHISGQEIDQTTLLGKVLKTRSFLRLLPHYQQRLGHIAGAFTLSWAFILIKTQSRWFSTCWVCSGFADFLWP